MKYIIDVECYLIIDDLIITLLSQWIKKTYTFIYDLIAYIILLSNKLLFFNVFQISRV